MDLIEHRDMLGRKAVRPQFETDLPLFKHITNGAISVTTEAWNDEFYLVAMVHGISGVIKPLEDSC